MQQKGFSAGRPLTLTNLKEWFRRCSEHSYMEIGEQFFTREKYNE
jgi:hypothetical protein